MAKRLLISAATLAVAFAGTAFAQSLPLTARPIDDWIKLSAIAIAATAVILIVLSIALWRVAARARECCSDKAVRGYLFPLAPDLLREGGGGAFVLTRLGNFGRTPCILKESYLEALAAEPTGDHPAYQNGRLTKHDHVFDVNAQDERLDVPALPVNDAVSSYLVGYFRYLDVFGVTHMTRYCYLVRPEIARFERAGPAAWNAFD